MANAASKIAETAMSGKTIIEYRISIDTVDTDLTIHTPASGNQVFVMNVIGSDSTAANITWKSGSSTTIVPPELAANQGLWGKVNRDEFCFFTAINGALVIQSSAAITGLLVHVYENNHF